MFEYVLDCPQCNHRFHYEHDGSYLPEEIQCPQCKSVSPAIDFYALILCSECRSKLKIPLDMLNEAGNACPKCGAEIQSDRLASLGESGNTIADFAASKAKKRMLQDGEFFDKFQIISLLGRGGMAEVYLAEHLLLKQKCALKLMRQALDQEKEPVFIKRFVREAKLTHSLNHPNIVKVFDAGSDFKTGHLFLAMEYVEGRTLHDIINEQELSEAELIEILTVIANALKPLEEAKVVHRDIKPSNIMYTTEGIYKLMDLGIAKVESNQQAGDMTLTMEQSTIGTPGYASPEQCSAAHQVDIRSDIFSLGATIYHAASGFVPFAGDTPVAAILNTMQKEPESLAVCRPDLSDDFIKLVEKMMKKKPADRFQSIDELLEALEKIKKVGNASAPVRKIRRIAAALTTGFSTVANTSRKKSGRVLLGIGKFVFALLIVALAAVHVYYVVSRLESGTKPDYAAFMKNILTLRKPNHQPAQHAPRAVNNNSLIRAYDTPMAYDTHAAHKKFIPGKGTVFPVVEMQKRPFAEHKFHNEPGGVRTGNNSQTSSLSLTQGRSRLSGWSIYVNFKLNSNDAEGIFRILDTDVCVYKQHLWIFQDRYFVNTQIVIPAGCWVNLTISADNTKGKIDIFSGSSLLGSYFTQPQYSISNTFVYVHFHSLRIIGIKKKYREMDGQIDYLVFSPQPAFFKTVTPQTYEKLLISETKLPETFPFGTTSHSVAAIRERRVQVSRTAAAPAQTTPVSGSAARPAPAKTVKTLETAKENNLPFIDKSVFLPETQQTSKLKFPESSVKLMKSLKSRISTLSPKEKDAAKKIIDKNQQLRGLWELRVRYIKQRNKKIAETAQKKYDDELGRTVQKKFAEYTQNKSDWGYNGKCEKFSEKLLSDFRNPRLDPNIRLEDKRYSSYSGNALKAVSSGRIVQKEKLYDVLSRRYADPACLEGLQSSSATFDFDLINYGLPAGLIQHNFNRRFAPEYREKNNVRLIELLLCDGAIPTADHLAQAVISNRSELVVLLLAWGMDPNEKNSKGETALFNTYRLSNGKALRTILLAAGADPAIENSNGQKAQELEHEGKFMAAWNKGATAEIDRFFSAGVDPNMELSDGNTLLHDACERNDINLVKVLLKHKADPNKRGKVRHHPLAVSESYVAFRKSVRNSDKHKEADKAAEIMKFLVKNGADIRVNPFGYGGRSLNIFWKILSNCCKHSNYNSRYKRSSYSETRERERQKTLRRNSDLLLTLAEYTNNFSEEHWSSCIREVKYLPVNIALKIIDKVPQYILQKRVALLFASYGKTSPELVHALARKGVNFNELQRTSTWDPAIKRTIFLQAPVLYLAAKSGQSPETVKALLEYNVDVNWKDANGKTAFDVATDPAVKKLLRSRR